MMNMKKIVISGMSLFVLHLLENFNIKTVEMQLIFLKNAIVA